jgi:sugar phosphate isomerase/epimerase
LYMAKGFNGPVARRKFVSGGLALFGVAAAIGAAPAGVALASLDPADPGIRFGLAGSAFGGWPKRGEPMKDSQDIPGMIKTAARYGFQGFEPYSTQIGDYLNRPLAIKKLCNDAGIEFIDIGDMPRSLGPQPPPSPPGTVRETNPFGSGPYPWLGEEGNAELIRAMVQFARNNLVPAGCDHWKMNLGGRPKGGPSTAQLKALARTLNEIGEQTIEFGVRAAPHPHIWGPMERENEFRTIMDLTDPRFVWLTLDTGHNVLGGMDTVKIVSDYLPRIAEFHLKDTYAKYRGNKVTPANSEYLRDNIWGTLGVYGGVDFPGIFDVLRKHNWKGWAVVDVDGPRPGDGTGSVNDNLAKNVNYLRDVLHVKMPPPTKST